MEVLPRLCCSGLDALMASPIPPRLVLSPQQERLWVVDERGTDSGTLDWCPVCGGELPWSERLRSTVPPEHRASMRQPAREAAVGSRFTVQAAGRYASGVVIALSAQGFTCRVALWLGRGRDPWATPPDVLTEAPLWPLATGSWPIDGVEPDLADAIRAHEPFMRAA